MFYDLYQVVKTVRNYRTVRNYKVQEIGNPMFRWEEVIVESTSDIDVPTGIRNKKRHVFMPHIELTEQGQKHFAA